MFQQVAREIPLIPKVVLHRVNTSTGQIIYLIGVAELHLLKKKILPFAQLVIQWLSINYEPEGFGSVPS